MIPKKKKSEDKTKKKSKFPDQPYSPKSLSAISRDFLISEKNIMASAVLKLEFSNSPALHAFISKSCVKGPLTVPFDGFEEMPILALTEVSENGDHYGKYNKLYIYVYNRAGELEPVGAGCFWLLGAGAA